MEDDDKEDKIRQQNSNLKRPRKTNDVDALSRSCTAYDPVFLMGLPRQSLPQSFTP